VITSLFPRSYFPEWQASPKSLWEAVHIFFLVFAYSLN
jgi:hypothetical protein